MDNARATRAELNDPERLAALGRVEHNSRWIDDCYKSRLHPSPRKAFSVEFA